MTNTTKQAENPIVTEAVNKFLGWKLPANFYPDHAIVFHKDKCEFDRVGGWPIGTNLFTADQAKAMFEHCLQNTRADLVKPIQAEPDGYCIHVAEHDSRYYVDDLDEACDDLTNHAAVATAIYSADTVRALQLEAIRKTLAKCDRNAQLANGDYQSIENARIAMCQIKPEEILNSLNRY